MEYAELLKKEGFEVYAPEHANCTYFYFVKGVNIGYVQYDMGSFSFSTVHKPCTSCGTGYSVERDVVNPTAKMAEYCFINRPHWADSKNEVQKYKDWNEYINSPMNQIVKKVKI